MSEPFQIDENLLEDDHSDTPVIRQLRKQLREAHKEIRNAPTAESLEPHVRAKIERESAIDDLLERFGHPAKMRMVVASQLQTDQPVTPGSVAAALGNLGYQIDVDAALAPQAPATPAQQITKQQQDLRNVSNLASQVASASSGFSTDLASQISQTRNSEELKALMAEKGLLMDGGGY